MDPMVKKMFESIEEKYGKPVSEWVELVKASGLEKHGERINFLKKEHGFSHGFANLVVHEAKNPGIGAGTKPGDDELLEAQFKGKEDLRKLYDLVIAAVEKFGPDVDVSVKKNYVSLRRDVQFGILQPSAKSRLDVGLVLKEDDSSLEKAGSFNSMCSHRIRLEGIESPDKETIGWLKKAYETAKR
ncbi:DUF4287 domain-containing protein [Fulvivirga sedimenti]|uniref:DUF4287 domain-containing protein n=1 Tax=Fulvivirga sedimenti TaxID=2879465 RepID=A0A9X1HMZ5_9BACT|nr:DUF4287 domain-containing protein [Fulvivirga sedimenti]MCA6073975.1 DUF4287 domain-containing protein [Fulvivirga sedimenti]